MTIFNKELIGDLFLMFRGERLEAYLMLAQGKSVQQISAAISADKSKINSWIGDWEDQQLIFSYTSPSNDSNIILSIGHSDEYFLTDKGKSVKNIFEAIDREIAASDISKDDIKIDKNTLSVGSINVSVEGSQILEELLDDAYKLLD